MFNVLYYSGGGTRYLGYVKTIYGLLTLPDASNELLDGSIVAQVYFRCSGIFGSV